MYWLPTLSLLNYFINTKKETVIIEMMFMMQSCTKQGNYGKSIDLIFASTIEDNN